MADTATVPDYRHHAALLPSAPMPARPANPAPLQPAASYVAPVRDPSRRLGLAQALASLAGAVAVVLAVPLVIAVVALVVARAWDLVRGQI